MSRRRVIVPALVSVLVLAGISACRITLDDPVEYSSRTCAVTDVAACTEAAQHSDLAWIEANVFNKCTFSGCHNGAMTDAGRLDLSPTKSFAGLVNVDSQVAAGPTLTGKAKMVVPMMPRARATSWSCFASSPPPSSTRRSPSPLPRSATCPRTPVGWLPAARSSMRSLDGSKRAPKTTNERLTIN